MCGLRSAPSRGGPAGTEDTALGWEKTHRRFSERTEAQDFCAPRTRSTLSRGLPQLIRISEVVAASTSLSLYLCACVYVCARARVLSAQAPCAPVCWHTRRTVRSRQSVSLDYMWIQRPLSTDRWGYSCGIGSLRPFTWKQVSDYFGKARFGQHVSNCTTWSSSRPASRRFPDCCPLSNSVLFSG